MRWFWSRRAHADAAALPPDVMAFDVSIDVGDRGAVGMIGARVRAMPGAGWVSVEAHAGTPLSIRLFEAGTSIEAVGEAWAQLRQGIEREARAALAACQAPPQEIGWSMPEVAQAGFAEALAPSPLESKLGALEQLAVLARMSQLPAPQATPLPVAQLPVVPPPVVVAPVVVPDEDREDVERLTRLLALVLAPEATRNDAMRSAAAAVRRLGSYAAVLAAPEAELRAVPGLGTHSVAAIKLIHAAAIRLSRAGIAGRPVLADRERLNAYLATALGRERVEQFRILFLDEKGMLRADEVQARGTVNHTPVYPREVVRRALALQAKSLVLVHNHPSGDPAPSRDDIEMTKQVREAAAVMNIGLRDHVIVGNGRWLSFADEGYLNQ